MEWLCDPALRQLLHLCLTGQGMRTGDGKVPTRRLSPGGVEEYVTSTVVLSVCRRSPILRGGQSYTQETSGWLRSLLVSRFLHLERELNTSTCFLGSRFVATAGRSGPWDLHVQLSQCRLSSPGCVVAVRLSRGVLSESELPVWLTA